MSCLYHFIIHNPVRNDGVNIGERKGRVKWEMELIKHLCVPSTVLHFTVLRKPLSEVRSIIT